MMARRSRWFFRLLLFVLLLVAAAVALAPFVPLTPLKPAVESRLSATLGRDVTVSSVRLSLLGGPYLVMDNMTAKEDPDFGEGNFLEANQVRANLALWPLALRRQVVIEGLRLQQPQFRFVKNGQGAWSWTTLGQPGAASAATRRPRNLSVTLMTALVSAFQVAAGAALNELKIEKAAVRLVDQSGAQPPESLYKNVDLHASISPHTGASRRATGELRADSDEGDGATMLKAQMPFDLTIDRGAPAGLAVQGAIGPGQLETRNIAVANFKSSLTMKGGNAVFEQMEADLAEGTLRGRMELDLSNQKFITEGRVEHLNFDQALASKLQMPGQITGHVNAEFKLAGLMTGFQEAIPTISGGGRMSSNDLFISSMNLSERVAQALRIAQIGDMNPGTGVGSIEADFQIEQGMVRTSNLRIQQLDGLGDATANEGWLSVAAAPTINYQAYVTLSADATAKAKASNPLLGAAITIFEINNRVTVPVNITGDPRNPQVQVDVRRLL
ncbi:MAG TPA: AsmA-like C-terminal region-containing protein [Blastocatellia bacterium]|nr:AsmA-like C-terminal region-containing protein [Blastocatellia bacterium]